MSIPPAFPFPRTHLPEPSQEYAALLRRFPRLRLAIPDEGLPCKQGTITNALSMLLLTW
ncbi:MAG: hypothetical protein JWL58_1824 [Streptosporangiaceae bacterium]|jgi:hypothetical protein|nr:hypothetical protein [Streptosporangiaceae bacterium]